MLRWAWVGMILFFIILTSLTQIFACFRRDRVRALCAEFKICSNRMHACKGPLLNSAVGVHNFAERSWYVFLSMLW